VKETKLNDNLGYLLNTTANAINTLMQRAIGEEEIDVPLEQLKVLMYVSTHEGVNQQMICDSMNRVKPGVSRLVDGLEKKGLISRKEDKNDRRNKILQVTKKGLHVRERFYPIAIKNLKGLESSLGANESKELKKHLIGIREIILERLKSN